MSYIIKYHEGVAQYDIPKLSKKYKQRVHLSIEQKLTSAPELFGNPLRKSLKGYRKLRVGDYLVVYRIQSGTVLVLVIANRSVVYPLTGKRV